MMNMSKLPKMLAFVSANFVVFPDSSVLPQYFRDTNRTLEMSRELATITVGVSANELSDYCLAACANGFAPWQWSFIATIDKVIFSREYPIAENMAEFFDEVAKQLLIDAIESGARDWALANASSD
jgi:hypothetical protein